jgi:phosphopantothenoylcysteine decarboxylase / phosphopantothenate---cysteine ligase
VKIALGVTGCIAAYKAVEVMRGLQKAGACVHAVLTRSAARFIGPLTFESLSGNPVVTHMFARDLNRDIEHIRLAQSIELLAVVPATANALGKFANGIADDFLSTLYLSCPAPVLLAPAMNVDMWNHPAVRRNISILKERGHHFVNPASGMLACGMEGEGRLAEVDDIVAHILQAATPRSALPGLRVLVTAGPTVEDIDPVRFLSNRSSGKMGYAVAQTAAARGAEVVLVSGPTTLPAPSGVRIIPVRSAADMKKAVLDNFASADLVIKAAAVSDYRPLEVAREKIKKGVRQMAVQLVANDDILEQLGRAKTTQVLVGFAAETEDLAAHAREKMARKNLDLVVANDVSSGVFGAEAATVHIIDATGATVTLQNQSKLAIAGRILEMAAALHQSRAGIPSGSASQP